MNQDPELGYQHMQPNRNYLNAMGVHQGYSLVSCIQMSESNQQLWHDKYSSHKPASSFCSLDFTAALSLDARKSKDITLFAAIFQAYFPPAYDEKCTVWSCQEDFCFLKENVSCKDATD